MTGNLYIIRNDVNDKVYVGKTYRSIEYRFKQHIRDSKDSRRKNYNYKFYRAMRKHGADKFHIELLGVFEQGILEQKEIEYIAKYDSYHNGYNSTLGGDGLRKLELDEKAIIEMWDNGKNSTNIARELGVSPHTINDIIHASGRTYSLPEISLIAYDDCYNRIAILKTRNEIEQFLRQRTTISISYIRDINDAIERDGSLYGFKWQYLDDVFYDNKEFNATYDKKQYIAGKECIEINGILFAERPDLELNYKTGCLYLPDNKIIIKGNNGTVVINKEELIELAKISTVQQIANKYRISSTNLEKRLNKYGIKTVKIAKELSSKCPPKEELEKVKHLPKTQIAKIYGVSDVTIKKWFAKYNITDGFKQKFDIPPKEELEEKTHMSALKIGKLYGVSPHTVLEWLKEYNLTLDSQIKNSKIKTPDISELKKVSYLSYRAIAKKYGVSKTTVMRWFSDNNIEKP